jgi:hypothetical protein
MTDFCHGCYEPFDYTTLDFFTSSKTTSSEGRLSYNEVVNYYIMVETTKPATHLIALIFNA